jgi:D-amino-acid oxidase
VTGIPDVLVIGAGVSGLTTGIILAEAGAGVLIEAAEPPQETTSAVAGALWGTHLVGAEARVPGWVDATHQVLMELARDEATGVHVASGVLAFRDPAEEPPEAPNSTVVTELTRCDPASLPAGFAAGWRLTAPMVCMPDYLDYLLERFRAAGGTLHTPRRFASLAGAAGATQARVIVNCTGADARHLVPDPGVVPARGQVVVVSNPGLTEFFVGSGADPNDLTYLFPHRDIVVLGGTQEQGNGSREPDPDTAAAILAACTAVAPELAGAKILAHRAGLRPTRPQVRLEAQDIAGGRRLVHNYGHGGAGISLSWGCAAQTAKLAAAALG